MRLTAAAIALGFLALASVSAADPGFLLAQAEDGGALVEVEATSADSEAAKPEESAPQEPEMSLEQEALRLKVQYRRQPAVRQPGLVPKLTTLAPPASPILGVAPAELHDTLTARLGFDAQEAFAPVDWTQPFRDIRADEMEGMIGEEEALLTGNVRLNLDNVRFAADQFWYSESTGEMRATGNVIVLQKPAVVMADELYYRVPSEEDMPRGKVLEPYMTEQERARLRLSSGNIEARNVQVLQPNQQIQAERMEYNIETGTGLLEGVQGRSGVYRFEAKRLTLGGIGNLDLEEGWFTSSQRELPMYKVLMDEISIRDGQAVYAAGAQLQLGKAKTPLYWPRWGMKSSKTGPPLGFDFDSGHRAKIGYFINTGQQFQVSRDVTLGLRLFPTTKEGVGLGLESQYDFMDNPASPLYLSKGDIRSLYTTEDRGHLELYHQHVLGEDTRALVQVEQWSDRDFLKDYYYEEYQDRTAPRSFVNITHRKPGYIATATVQPEMNGFVRETERLPEGTFHLIERPIAKNLYVTFDTIDGYVEREPWSYHSVRSVNVGRLTYSLDLDEALSITPFVEGDATYYSDTRDEGDSEGRFAATTGVTLQTRLHRKYPGAFGFDGFKHIILPSLTYSYRPESSMGVDETPRFDAYDVSGGRSRLETKIDNIVFGKNAETDEVWQVARLSLYHGNDFWNEIRKASDYEAELDLRPRPWWGWLFAGEYHSLEDSYDFRRPLLIERAYLTLYEKFRGRPYHEDEYLYDYDPQYGDYRRILTYMYYDDTMLKGKFNAHMGLAYTETQDRVFNREIIYGGGYRLSENWGLGFEHRYDFERDEMAQQMYEVRHRIDSFEAALQFRDRNEGWDVRFRVSIIDFPGAKIQF